MSESQQVGRPEGASKQRLLCIGAQSRVCEETRHLVRLLTGLRGRGHEVRCFLPEARGLVAEALEAGEWWGLGRWWGEMLFRGEWVRQAAGFQPTVLVGGGWRSAPTARLLASALAVPLVLVVVGPPSGGLGARRRRAWTAAASRLPLRVVATHPELSDQLQSQFPALAGRCEVVTPGVPASPKPPEKDQEAEDRLAVVGMLTDPEESAGVEVLLRTARLLERSGHRAEYIIIGEGPEEPRLRRLARTLGIRHLTNFLPPMLEPGPVLAEMDVVVVLRHRGLALVSLLEAQAAGAAVVVPDGPAARRWVRDGVTGRLLPEPTPAALAAVVGELLEDEEGRRRLGERARRRVRREASLKRMLEAYEGLFQDLTAGPRDGSP